MTPENGTGPLGLEAITVHGASRVGSNCNTREWRGLLRFQKAELELSPVLSGVMGKRMSLKPPL